MAANPMTINTGVSATNTNSPMPDYKSLVSADVAAEGNGLWTRLELAAATIELEQKEAELEQIKGTGSR